MLKLLCYFVAGFLSDFLVVKFYQSVSGQRFFAAVTSNSLLMIANVIFVGIAVEKDLPLIATYVIGQNVGIILAMKINKREE